MILWRGFQFRNWPGLGDNHRREWLRQMMAQLSARKHLKGKNDQRLVGSSLYNIQITKKLDICRYEDKNNERWSKCADIFRWKYNDGTVVMYCKTVKAKKVTNIVCFKMSRRGMDLSMKKQKEKYSTFKHSGLRGVREKQVSLEMASGQKASSGRVKLLLA